ncbi:siderophore ABC transporter substrate-binding protein [Microterricola pindariensis]|uniref:siderophore ABC transporter substrate-binding protein n=1 Tax=Microterricola pindariensis TaxID=478010 RepID=UPI000CEC69F4|nr:siderophore ABC transporter substrate-binding protein [Microterricola pindariensis]
MTHAQIRPLGALALAAAGALLFAGCASPQGEAGTPPQATEKAASEITVTHAQGETVVPVNPQTVLVLDFGVLDTLDALDVDVAGVPKQNLPKYLTSYASDDYVDLGSLKEPNYEAVNAAAPDLIIVAQRSASALPELSAIAPTIDLTTDPADYLESFRANAETLGEIFEKQDEVDTAFAAIDEKIAAVQKLTPDAGTGLIVMTNAGEVTAFGPGSRFGWLHTELGLTAAVPDVDASTHGDPISFEFIREANPDWLFVVDRDVAVGESGGAAALTVLDNEVVSGTTAWQQDQVVQLDGTAWYIVISGLTAINTMIDEVADALA